MSERDDRFTVIPRTLIFVRRGDEYLLIKGAASKAEWAGKYNGLGGHVEAGEDALTSARRELLEESRLKADLWLCGTLFVDGGICVFVFCGENAQGEIKAGSEGAVSWVRTEIIPESESVEDLAVLIARVHGMKRGDAPFSARSFRRGADLIIEFAEE